MFPASPQTRSRFFLSALLINAFLLTPILAIPRPNPIPQLAAGTQFITGACTSDADCASGCCGFNSGKCAGPIVAQERDGGCGFGDATPNDRAAVALRGGSGGGGAAAGGQVVTGNAGNGNAGNGNNAGNNNNGRNAGGAARASGTQFITGACTSDADCASGCCGFNSGKCAGPVVAQERDGGCGFGDTTPNDRAAVALRGGGGGGGAGSQAVAGNGGNNNAGNGGNGGGGAGGAGARAAGTQFITGACTSDADCASGCCGFNSGKCAGPVVAQERDGGCGFGDVTPNDTAARAFRGQ